MKRQSEFVTNLNCIELIITYCCNRQCYNCQAMVRQAPSKDAMTVEQIKKFICETVEEKIKWNTIRIMGGEPTLHPNIEEIVRLLCEYRIQYSVNTKIVIVTNGYGDMSRVSLNPYLIIMILLLKIVTKCRIIMRILWRLIMLR